MLLIVLCLILCPLLRWCSCSVVSERGQVAIDDLLPVEFFRLELLLSLRVRLGRSLQVAFERRSSFSFLAILITTAIVTCHQEGLGLRTFTRVTTRLDGRLSRSCGCLSWHESIPERSLLIEQCLSPIQLLCDVCSLLVSLLVKLLESLNLEVCLSVLIDRECVRPHDVFFDPCLLSNLAYEGHIKIMQELSFPDDCLFEHCYFNLHRSRQGHFGLVVESLFHLEELARLAVLLATSLICVPDSHREFLQKHLEWVAEGGDL